MIETTIAKIIDETRVVLAAGKEQGVREGMEFVIYGLGPEVFDPETKQSLGQLELVKGRVIASYVQDKICTARTRRQSIRWPLFTATRLPFELMDTVYEKLPIEEKSTDYEEDLRVRVGDRARSVEVEAEVTPSAVAP